MYDLPTISKPKQTRDGTWVIKSSLSGTRVQFDTSLSPLGPWCMTTNGASARKRLAGGKGATEVDSIVAEFLWESVREVERSHIRQTLKAAAAAGVSEKARDKLKALAANKGRATPWEVIQVRRSGKRYVIARRVQCGGSLLIALAVYRKLIAEDRHTLIRKAS